MEQKSGALFILKARPESLRSPEEFLANRKWEIHSATSVKTALTKIMTLKPAYVLLSVENPFPHMQKVPALIAQAFPEAEVILFSESNNTHSFAALRDWGIEYTLYPPISGPSIERMILRIERDREKRHQEELQIVQKGPGVKASDVPEVINIKGSAISKDPTIVDEARRLLVGFVNSQEPSMPHGMGYQSEQENDSGGSRVQPPREPASNDNGSVINTLNKTKESQAEQGSHTANPATVKIINPQVQTPAGHQSTSQEAAGQRSVGQQGTEEPSTGQQAAGQSSTAQSSTGQAGTGQSSTARQASDSAAGPAVDKAQQKTASATPRANKSQSASDAKPEDKPEDKSENYEKAAGLEHHRAGFDLGKLGATNPPLSGDKPSKVIFPGKDSLIAAGTAWALENSAVLKLAENVERPSVTTNVACIAVESKVLSGYLIAAFGENRRIDKKFLELVRDRLEEFMRAKGEELTTDSALDLSLQEVEFESWAIDQAEFLRKTVHDGNEVAMAFFPPKQKDIELEKSASDQMLMMDMSELVGGETVEFDLYVYLPANDKYVLYTRKGEKLPADQRDRLVSKGVNKMHLHKDTKSEVRRYRVRNYLNQKISAFKQSK